MPGLDGQALVAKLAEHGLSLLPVLYMSGMPRPASVPPECFLAKPFDLALLLRAAVDAIAGQLTPSAALPDEARSGAVPRPPRVLVVEDDAETRGVVHALLVHAGYDVLVAATGAQALVGLAAEDVALVLLDLMLPDMDGLEVCARVRAREADTYLPI